MKQFCKYLLISLFFGIQCILAQPKLFENPKVHSEGKYYLDRGKLLADAIQIKFKEKIFDYLIEGRLADFTQIKNEHSEIKEMLSQLNRMYGPIKIVKMIPTAKWGDTIVTNKMTGERKRVHDLSQIFSIKFSSLIPIDSVLQEFNKCKIVAYVEPPLSVVFYDAPNDPYYTNNSQWNLGVINSSSAWGITHGSSAINIGIIDEGCKQDHEDLIAKIAGSDGQNGTHGTWVAGVAAAATNNNLGVASIGWNTMLYTYGGLASTSEYVADQILSAASNCNILNMSWGTVRAVSLALEGELCPDCPPTFQRKWVGAYIPSSDYVIQDVVETVVANGVICIASAGNSSANGLIGPAPELCDPWKVPFVSYPAAYEGVIAVSGTRSVNGTEQFVDGWNYGNFVTLAAPGYDILTTDISGGYSTVSGTSFSSPLVCSVVSLIQAINPTLSSSTIKTILINSTDQVDAARHSYVNGRNDYLGYGRVNAYKALKYTLENYGGTLTQSITIPSGETWNFAAGVTVKFATGVSLTSNGVININGTSSSPVTFTSVSGLSTDSWGPVIINSGASLSIAQNSALELGPNGSLNVYGNLTVGSEASIKNIANITIQTSGVLTVNSNAILKFNSAPNVSIEGSPKGALVVNGRIHADGATFTSNSDNASNYWSAIYIINSRPSDDGNFIRNCTISQCKFGMTISNSTFSCTSDEIYHNTFTHCLNPIRLTNSSSVNRITENTLQDNLEDGIVIYESTVASASGNVIGKSQATYSGRDGFWVCGSGVQPLLTSNTIQYGSGNGVRCEDLAAPNLGGPNGTTNSKGLNKITNNSAYGVKAQSGTLPFLGEYEQDVCYPFGGSNSIYDNLTKQFYVETPIQEIHAKFNWWGRDPDNGLGFTAATKNILFAGYPPLVDPALMHSEPHPLIASSGLFIPSETTAGISLSMQEEGSVFQSVFYTTSASTDSSTLLKETAANRERILLMLADQLVLAKRYESALAVYDTLIRQYPGTDEAGTAVLRVNNTLHLYNNAIKTRLVSGSVKSGFEYFNALLDGNVSNRFEQSLLELAAVNASNEGEFTQAITLHQKIAKQYPNTESEKHALGALVELSWKMKDKDAANGYLAALQSKYSNDPVTALLCDMKYMVENVGALVEGTSPSQSEATFDGNESEKLEEKAPMAVPMETALYPNYPNPFNPSTMIAYSLLTPGMVDVTVYDVLGREVAQLVHEYQEAGRKTVQFDGSHLASNIYFVRMATQGRVFTQRMLLVK